MVGGFTAHRATRLATLHNYAMPEPLTPRVRRVVVCCLCMRSAVLEAAPAVHDATHAPCLFWPSSAAPAPPRDPRGPHGLPLPERCLPWRARPRRPHAPPTAACATGLGARVAAVAGRCLHSAEPECHAVLHARVRPVAEARRLPHAPAASLRGEPALLRDPAVRQRAEDQPGLRPPRHRVPSGVEGGELLARVLFLLQHVGAARRKAPGLAAAEGHRWLWAAVHTPWAPRSCSASSGG
jgi:hypothetical protein